MIEVVDVQVEVGGWKAHAGRVVVDACRCLRGARRRRRAELKLENLVAAARRDAGLVAPAANRHHFQRLEDAGGSATDVTLDRMTAAR